MKFLILALAATTIATTLGASFASAQTLRHDPNRPTDLISRDLGVSEIEFISCFSNVNPEQKGITPSGEKQRANKAVLLPCLQNANSAITNDLLDEVMDRYRPEGAFRKTRS